MSLMNEGPAPRCLSPLLFEALVSGTDNVNITLDDVPQSALKEDLQVVRQQSHCERCFCL